MTDLRPDLSHLEGGRAEGSGHVVACAEENEAAVGVPVGKDCMLRNSSCAVTFAERFGMRNVSSMCDSDERETANGTGGRRGVIESGTRVCWRTQHGAGTNGPLEMHVSLEMSVAGNQELGTVVSCEILSLPASFRAKGWTVQVGGSEPGSVSSEVCPSDERVVCSSVCELSESCAMHELEGQECLSQEQHHSVALKHTVARNARGSSCSRGRTYEGFESWSRARSESVDLAGERVSERAVGDAALAGNVLDAGASGWLALNGTGCSESQRRELVQEPIAGSRLAELLQQH